MASDENQAPRVAISGTAGLIGGRLTRALSAAGWRVDPLVRRRPRPGTTEIEWDPARASVDVEALGGVHAVVHLGGAPVAGGRWTSARMAAIRDSRVLSTALLAECLANLIPPPGVFIVASAVGYYGDRGVEELTEESPPGGGFLAGVCQAWEAATKPASRAGIRVVNLRIGMVLARDGGALPALLGMFSKGLGGKLGNGRQYVSWIGVSDLVRSIHHVIEHDDLSGPVNAVAPVPVQNVEFTRTLGQVLRRPTFAAVPAFVVRTVFGQMGRELLLASTRAYPHRLTASGFSFRTPTLQEALRLELGV